MIKINKLTTKLSSTKKKLSFFGFFNLHYQSFQHQPVYRILGQLLKLYMKTHKTRLRNTFIINHGVSL